jgi:hypothetical protein
MRIIFPSNVGNITLYQMMGCLPIPPPAKQTAMTPGLTGKWPHNYSGDG